MRHRRILLYIQYGGEQTPLREAFIRQLCWRESLELNSVTSPEAFSPETCLVIIEGRIKGKPDQSRIIELSRDAANHGVPIVQILSGPKEDFLPENYLLVKILEPFAIPTLEKVILGFLAGPGGRLRPDLSPPPEDLERRIKQRTADLEAINGQLQAEIIEKVIAQGHLERAKEEAVAANQAKTRFLANMSHELRTPLNGILGFSDLMKAQVFGPLNPKQKDYIEQILNSGKHLLNIINDLLDIAKIDVDSVQLREEDFEGLEFIRSTVAMVRTQAKKRNIQLTFTVSPEIAGLRGDRRKLRQILLNFLSNALKFTPEGGSVKVELKKEFSVARFSVTDSGPGIPPKSMSSIFSEFYQVDQERDQALGGTGIGLALSRRLAELHQGKIGVDSNLGAGSTFWFTLPLPPSDQGSASPASSDAIALDGIPPGRKILIVEDNEVNLKFLMDFLDSFHLQISVARNGNGAVDLARAESFDLVFMDIRMPGMDGLEATSRIKSLETFSAVPVVALTAGADSLSMESCRKAGFSDILTKPVQLPEVFSVLKKYLHATK